jgi:ABC-type sugar transport system permease subunit
MKRNGALWAGRPEAPFQKPDPAAISPIVPVGEVKMRKFRLKLNNELKCLAFYGPALAIYTALSIMSTVMLFFYSFTDWNGLAHHFNFAGLKNYIEMWSDDVFITSMKNSLLFLVIYPVVTLIPALILAVLIDNMTRAGNFVKSGFFFPAVLNGVAVSFIWTYMYRSDIGVINTLLRTVGLQALQVNWLGNLNFVILSITVVAAWQGIGVPMMLLLASLKTVPRDILEAAEIDGAGFFKKFTRITLPYIWPTFNVCMLLAVTSALKIFVPIYVCTYGGPGYMTYSIVMYIVHMVQNSGRVGYASAIGAVFFIIVMCISLVQFKLMGRKETDL